MFQAIRRILGRTFAPNEPKMILLEPQIIRDTPRSRCPFYGFHAAMGCFMDTEGNGCGIVIDSFSPCRMEREGKLPDWGACPFTVDGVKDLSGLSKLQIFPREFRPANKNEWEGIPFRIWEQHIMANSPENMVR